MTLPVRRRSGRNALRWALVAAVLGLAAAVALWPRDVPPAEPASARSSPAAGTDLAHLRQRAALRPCPQPAQAAPATGALAAVRLPCLGADGSVDLGAALAGRAVLLNVWSHTCEPCREELPVLDAYAARPGAVEVLGVQVEGSPQAGLAVLTALKVHLPSLADPDGVLRAAMSAPQVLPLSYLVAPDGSVRMVNPPVVFRSPEQVDLVARRYLAEAAR